jgi:hypothetical protein
MPVQINEVIVRAAVNPSSSSTESTTAECPPSAGGTESEIAEQVLEIIKEKNKR